MSIGIGTTYAYGKNAVALLPYYNLMWIHVLVRNCRRHTKVMWRKTLMGTIVFPNM